MGKKKKNASSLCPCGSGREAATCCQPFLRGEQAPATAEALMRSRFTAYFHGDQAYLLRTWDPATRPASLALEPEIQWSFLKILAVTAGGGAGISPDKFVFAPITRCKDAAEDWRKIAILFVFPTTWKARGITTRRGKHFGFPAKTCYALSFSPQP